MTCLTVTQPVNCTARIKTGVSDRRASVPNFNEHFGRALAGGGEEQERRDPEMHGSAQYSEHSHSFGGWGEGTHRKSATTEI